MLSLSRRGCIATWKLTAAKRQTRQKRRLSKVNHERHRACLRSEGTGLLDGLAVSKNLRQKSNRGKVLKYRGAAAPLRLVPVPFSANSPPFSSNSLVQAVLLVNAQSAAGLRVSYVTATVFYAGVYGVQKTELTAFVGQAHNSN